MSNQRAAAFRRDTPAPKTEKVNKRFDPRRTAVSKRQVARPAARPGVAVSNEL